MDGLISPIKLTALTREQSVKEWAVLSGFLEKAIARTEGRVTIESTFKFVESGEIMLLIAWDPNEKQVYAVFGVEALTYPGKRVFNITLCGGAEIDKWGHLYPAFKQIAKEMGFNQIEISGRAGWKKFLPGAKGVGRVFVEDLEVKDGRQVTENNVTN